MRLKRLELYGYKSFASRSVFEFPAGITAIVGPNGSGKSNIADAIRWVLGEQSFRLLRATSTEDMIFAGSHRRTRLGMAEVLLTLDNSDGSLPIDYTEVTIGRRAYRSGENEYLLNGNRVRYRDILDLLEPAGLARSPYLVIGQGMVDAALALRPQARRILFEEAAGIGPHLRKRAEALRRIEETQRNLQRVNDILNELRPRVASLQRQAERAAEYLLLRQDLQQLQRIWYGYHWQRYQRELAHLQSRLQAQEALLSTQKNRLGSLENELVALQSSQAEQRRSLDDLRKQETLLRGKAEGLHRELAVANERKRLYQQQLRLLETEIQELHSRQQVLSQEIEHASEEIDTQQKLYEASQKELQSFLAKLKVLEGKRHQIEAQLAQGQKELRQTIIALSDNQARLEQAKEERARLEDERGSGQEALAALREKLQRAQRHLQEIQQEKAAAQKIFQDLLQKRQELEKEAGQTRSRVEQANQSLARLENTYRQLRERYETLSRLRQEMTGYFPGVRAVLGGNLSGILGTVATLVSVPQEFERAIEAALGSQLQYIVTERWQDAENAIAFLKKTQAGWATFLPLDTLRPRAALTTQASKDIVGVASSLVQFEEHLHPVFELLLGRVLIVPDLGAARRLLRRNLGASLFVTLQGETVQPSGALSGGTKRRTSHLLAQEREWRELPQRLSLLEKQIQEATTALAAEQEYLEKVMSRLESVNRQNQEAQAKEEELHQRTLSQKERVRELEQECTWQERHLAQIYQQLQDLQSREEVLRNKLAQSRQREASLTAQLATLQEELTALGDEPLRQQAAELETRTAVALRTVQSQRQLVKSLQNNLAQLDEQLENKQAQRQQLAQSLQELKETLTKKQQQLAQLEERIQSLSQQRDPILQRLAELDAQKQALEQQLLRDREHLHAVELELNRLHLEQKRLQDQQMALANEIETNLGPIELPSTISHQLRLNLGEEVIELPQVKSLPQGLGAEIRQLRARLRRLGNVNPEAPQEYKELLERQSFLQTQVADLTAAIESLQEVIRRLDAIIERDFASTVKKVDKAFREYFQRLFGGGSARLVLTDPSDLSSTGIEIIAHPPGKRTQGLALLSGGERALTAAALLFALLQANPVPFCFLDEVDAALDEANVTRFRDLLLDHAQQIQFIIITHNRHTIEAASTIYGISMSEQGVSQSVSLKIGEETFVSAS
ncbi:MAG: chromosome segregation protein SMC [Anaerolineae bacterium]|nr:chromosome segregation protein SMC [Anaerolineae bacterium]